MKNSIKQFKNILLILFFSIVSNTLFAERIVVNGKIQFSDGQKLNGKIYMTRKGKLKIGANGQLRLISLNEIQKLKMVPEKKEMMQKWMFPEAGMTRKVKEGDPYPILYLKTIMTLKNKQVLEGHLYTTVLYLRDKTEKKHKIVILSKQQGKQGGKYSDIKYPAEITFLDDVEKPKEKIRFSVPDELVKPDSKVAVLSRPALTRVELSPTDKKNEFTVIGFVVQELFKGIETGNTIHVIWPEKSDSELYKSVEQALEHVQEFFDVKKLLSVQKFDNGRDIFSLMILSRRDKTTLNRKKAYPWRLEIWRWKYDKQTKKLMLSGKGYLFRGIVEKNGALPNIIIVND